MCRLCAPFWQPPVQDQTNPSAVASRLRRSKKEGPSRRGGPEKQILRACGAQDDSRGCSAGGGGGGRLPPYLPIPKRASCHPERSARNARERRICLHTATARNARERRISSAFPKSRSFASL